MFITDCPTENKNEAAYRAGLFLSCITEDSTEALSFFDNLSRTEREWFMLGFKVACRAR